MIKVTIIDGNDEIELSTAPKENIKAYMVKGEPGSDGVSPTATVSKSGSTTTITVTDKNGTTSEDVEDGYSPTVTTSKTNKITTLTITDIDGTRTTQILDGVDLTGGVPTNAVIGFDGTASEIPNGYELTNEPFPGAGSITVNDSYSTSTTEPYSANYVNNAIPTISDSYSTSTTEPYSANYINNLPQAITLETNVVTGVISATTRFALNSIRKKIGTQITANTSTNRIIIGDGVSNVMISAQVQGARQGTTPVQIELRKNGTGIKKAYMSATDSFQTLPILPFIEGVSSGDYFELYLVDGSINGSSGLSNQTLCYVTIEKIN